MKAARNSHTDVAKILLRNGAKVNTKNDNGLLNNIISCISKDPVWVEFCNFCFLNF